MIYNIGIIWPILSPQTGLRVQLVFSEAKVVCLIVSMKFGTNTLQNLSPKKARAYHLFWLTTTTSSSKTELFITRVAPAK